MQDDFDLSQTLISNAVLLTRWLRAMDPSPALSGPQASALGVIITARSITPSDIARLEEVKRPTIARTLGELAELGLIDRLPHPDDSRSVIIKATKKGLALFDRGRQRRAQPLDSALANLSDADIETLRRGTAVLTKVLEVSLRDS